MSQLARVACLILLCTCGSFALAQKPSAAASYPSDRAILLNLEPQPLEDALHEFSRITGLNVMFLTAVGRGIISPRVAGTLTPDTALRMLLKGAALRFEYLDQKTVAVLPDNAHSSQPTTRSISRLEGEAFKATSNEADTDATESRPSTQARESGPDQGSAASGSHPQKADKALEEIVVTGTNIRGSEDRSQKVIVLDKEYIQSTGISTTTRLLESLPQNFALNNQTGVFTPGTTDGGSQQSSISLRGLGQGTTLILINGRRVALGYGGAAVDISALPLTAIDRVEILTDGASAIYGSDAIGGVVNFILKEDYDGANTELHTGWAKGGVNEYRASQIVGSNWGTGSAMFSGQYYSRSLLRSSSRDFVPESSLVGSLLPDDNDYSGLFSGHQMIGDDVRLFADGLYTRRRTYNDGESGTAIADLHANSPQFNGAAGLDWKLAKDWQLELSLGFGQDKLDQTNTYGALYDGLQGIVQENFTLVEGNIKADGPILELPGGIARVAIGGEVRHETFKNKSGYPGHAEFGGVALVDIGQVVKSGFAELSIPVVGSANAIPALRRLDLSLAFRFDDYSTFGSSTNPKIGFAWEPVRGLRVRGSYASSYKAPNLSSYALNGNETTASFTADEASPGGTSYALVEGGSDVESYSAQRSKSYSLGLEWVPERLTQLQLDANYYRIKFSDRLGYPPLPTVILASPAPYSSLITRNPTTAQVNQAIAVGQLGLGFFPYGPDGLPTSTFSPDQANVIVDERQRNLSAISTNGLDLSANYQLDCGGSKLQFGVVGTYIFNLEQRLDPTSPTDDLVATYNNPPHWRGRGSAGWHRDRWDANIFVNYTDSYIDNRTVTAVPVASFATADITLAYNFRSGFMSGIAVSASVQNLLDRDPPRTAVLTSYSDVGFDPANASPLGRFINIDLRKRW